MKNQFYYPVLVLLTLFSLLNRDVASAQPFVDLFSVKTQYFSPKPYIGDPSGKLSVMQYEGNFLLPMEQRNKDVILFGGNFTQLSFTASGKTILHSNLYSTSLAAGYEKQWKNEKWKTMVMAIPKINGEQIDFSGNRFQMGGIALFTYKKKENLKYHFGLYYNKEFFGDYFMPLLGIDWKINDHMNLFGDMPANLNFEYRISNSFYTGVSYLTLLGTYRLNNGMYVLNGDRLWGDNQFKAYINCYIAKHIVWFAEGGQTFAHMYQLYNQNNEVEMTNPVYQRNIDGLFFNTGIALRFRTDAK